MQQCCVHKRLSHTAQTHNLTHIQVIVHNNCLFEGDHTAGYGRMIFIVAIEFNKLGNIQEEN